MSWRDILRSEAHTALPQFLEAHPHYSIDPIQPEYRGGTNYVTFAHSGPRPVVIKYFVTPARWNNEVFCLRHFAPTGVVPRVLDVAGDRWLVIERLPGMDGAVVKQMREARQDVSGLGRQIGSAVAKLAGVPLPACGEGYCASRDFACVPWGTPREVLERTVARCRKIVESVEPYGDPLFWDSLRLLESQLDQVDGHRQVLFHEDIWNLKIAGGRFAGFYDLEMCRLGTEEMQLASAMSLCGPDHFNWPDIQAGYEEQIGRNLGEQDLFSAFAIGGLYAWIRICHWGTWDGDPAHQHHAASSIQDAAYWRNEILARFRYFRRFVSLEAWFPSLRD